MTAWLLLALAIVAGVVGTSALKASEGFTRWVPSVVVVVGYAVAFYCLSLVLKTMAVGVAYAIWSGWALCSSPWWPGWPGWFMAKGLIWPPRWAWA